MCNYSADSCGELGFPVPAAAEGMGFGDQLALNPHVDLATYSLSWQPSNLASDAGLPAADPSGVELVWAAATGST